MLKTLPVAAFVAVISLRLLMRRASALKLI
jgi:hypothetical protein